MDKIYVVMMAEHCWKWEEPHVTPIFASMWKNNCDMVVDRLERELADDEVLDVHRSYYVDNIPYGNADIMPDLFVKNFIERHAR